MHFNLNNNNTAPLHQYTTNLTSNVISWKYSGCFGHGCCTFTNECGISIGGRFAALLLR